MPVKKLKQYKNKPPQIRHYINTILNPHQVPIMLCSLFLFGDASLTYKRIKVNLYLVYLLKL